MAYPNKLTEEELETGRIMKLSWEDQAPLMISILRKLSPHDQARLVCFFTKKCPEIASTKFFVDWCSDEKIKKVCI